jgi:uncharacterized RDD family membrane protein YckC
MLARLENPMSTPRIQALQGESEVRPAGVLVRLAAMTYESVLLFGVVFVVTYALLAVARWTYPLTPFQRVGLQSILFVVLGVYFTYQWSKSGQTLAMKSWHLRLVDRSGRPPPKPIAALRYVLAWHLVVPGALWIAFFGGHGPIDAAVTALGFVLLLIPARFDVQRRLLHDRISSTRIVREQ